MIRVPKSWCTYTKKPTDSLAYTNKMNLMYSRVAGAYDGFIKVFPLWSKWLRKVLPYIKGGRILEVSFGPGYLFNKYPKGCKVYGLDYNLTMVRRAKQKLRQSHTKAKLIQGNVESMPYPDNYFHTIVNTMAFSGYPDGEKALSEMLRVLKPGGKLLLLDYDYPTNRNLCGFLMVRFIELCGDIMKDITALLKRQDISFKRRNIGAFGSVQLFIVTKNS